MTEATLPAWIAETLGHVPDDLALFRQALTHPSLGEAHYQRLEFLGDRVLGLVIADWLYARHADEAEGKLAHRLNGLVSGEVCADVGRDIDITPWLRLGRQALDDGVFESDNVLGDVVEALIGALYLDGGMEAAERFIRKHWDERIGRSAGAAQASQSRPCRSLPPPVIASHRPMRLSTGQDLITGRSSR